MVHDKQHQSATTVTPTIRLTQKELMSEIIQKLYRMSSDDVAQLGNQLFNSDFHVEHGASGSFYLATKADKRFNRYILANMDAEILNIARAVIQNEVGAITNLKTKIRLALINSATPFSEKQLISAVNVMEKEIGL